MTQADDVHGGGGYADELRNHKFDGIEEFDNRLPNWWLWTFYGACIFSLFYWLHFHVLGTGALPMEAFRQEMAAYEANKPQIQVSDEELVAMSENPEVLDAGKAVFNANCVACHAENGGGTLNGAPLPGPNLTDNAWIHGGKPTDIHATITNGVIEKGMLQWGPILGAEKVKQVAAYVLSMRNTDVEGGKPPEGEPYKPDESGN